MAAVTVRRVPARRQPRFRGRAWREAVSFYAFIAPWLIGFLLLSVVPLVFGFGISLTNFDGLNLDSVKFVALSNYTRLLQDANALAGLSRTAVYTAFYVPLVLILALVLAGLLNQDVRGRSVFRTLFYLPYVIPIAAGAWIWRLLADGNYGLLNGLLDIFHHGTAIQWLANYATPTLVFFVVWSSVGGGMVILLAGLQGIPKELREAALIDGASPLRSFLGITVPLLTPVLFFQLVMDLIAALQAMVAPMLLTPQYMVKSSVVPSDNRLFMVNTYTEIFTKARFGYGSALLWVLFALVLVLTLIVFATSRFWVHYEVE
jgi:multiple sugar transport system permease protein